MPTGLIISLVFHAGLLVWAWFVMKNTPEMKIPDTPMIEATIITLSELTRLKKGDPDAKVLEAKAEEKPQPEKSQKEAEKPKPITAPEPPVAPPPPPPEEAKIEPPKPEPPPEKQAEPPPPAPGPTPDEQKALEEKLEQEKKAEEAKKAEEQRKADEKKKAEELKRKQERDKRLADAKKKAEEEKKKKAFDADKIAALLDKTPDKKGAPPVANTQPNQPTDNTGPAAGEREGNDTVLSAREADLLKGMLKQQLAPCWRLPGGGGGTSVPVVELKWRLRPDGSLDGEPSVTRPASGPAGQIAAEAALRAVKGCQPFRLPAESYQGWKDVIWEFDPSQML